ncbi:MAG: putative dehydrogenase, partial [Planctomycetota bacterium]
MARSTKRRKQPIGIGVIGLGFMGRTHLAAYGAANAAGQTNRIVAIADRGLARRGGKKRSAKAERGNLDTGDDG